MGPPATWSAEVVVDGRAYVFVPESDTFLALNESATRVWRYCDGTRDRDGIVAELLEVHGGTRGQVATVVDSALRLLADTGLLNPPAPPG